MTTGREKWRTTVVLDHGVGPSVENVRHMWVSLEPCSAGRGLPLASGHVVDCWIGVVQQSDRRLVQLAGRLSVAQVPELLGACAEEAASIHVDLTDLVSADAAGIEALQRLRGQGATLFGAPGYLQLKLDTPAGHAETTPLRASRPKGRTGPRE
jgi:ABC-type transporter Mla MlaB component